MIFPRGRPILLALLATLAVLATPTPASPAGRIVVFGAASGSHLGLSTKGSKIMARGVMAHTPPQGCHFVRGHHTAACPLAGAGAIEIDMGSSGDFVEVLDPMPVPVTVHLGAGEDKFIGNSENDTCYPEGTRRNRCVGGPGNDTCITGPRNSDCVGGPGDDYCRTSTGSDGCWGGPGNDVCYMGPGQDGCHGEDGNDRLYGEADPDQLYGGDGFDSCDGGPGVGRSHECEAGPGH
jgi:hemolysin type calcium-binding protein